MLGTLYAMLSVMDTVGSLLAGPIMANGLKLSLRLRDIWRGMPYIFSFLFCGVTAVILLRLRVSDVLLAAQDEGRQNGEQQHERFVDEQDEPTELYGENEGQEVISENDIMR